MGPFRPELSVLLLLAACGIDHGLATDKEAPFDTGEPLETGTEEDSAPPVEEACNGLDDDGDGEVDEGFPDDDGNGRADCTDVECPPLTLGVAGPVEVAAACADGVPAVIADPWNVVVEWQYTSTGAGVAVMPAVGELTDDNGDGRVDPADTPDVAIVTQNTNTLVLLDGATGAEHVVLSGYDGGGGVAIADVTADGVPEVVAFQLVGKVAAVRGDGTVEWVSDAGSVSTWPQLVVADLDADGLPEVVADTMLVDGESGYFVRSLISTNVSYRTPVCADLDQDGREEIVLGEQVYDADGLDRWDSPAADTATMVAVLQADEDPGGETLFLSRNEGWLHDDDGAELLKFTFPGDRAGPPAVSDFDGDGAPEICIPAETTLSVVEVDGTPVWQAAVSDSSGLAGCSGFDIDGDGATDVLYADETSFRIYDGRDGTVRFEDPGHESGTLWEYPVVADVDGDGAAEILVAENGIGRQGVTVYGHGGAGWNPAGPSWGTHDFAVTNVLADGSIPAVPEAGWLTYGDFRARPAVERAGSPDLTVAILDECVADCDYGPVELSVQVANVGGRDAGAGVSLRLYAVDDAGERLVAEQVLPAIPAGTALDGLQLDLEPADLGSGGWVVRVDEEGGLDECDEANNEDRVGGAGCG